MAVLLAVYYAFDWWALRVLLRSALVPVLGLLGYPSAPLDLGSALFVVVEDRHRFALSANCTYADLVLVAAPFCWRFGRPLAANLARIAALALFVWPLNLVRVAAALALYADGTPWLVAHTLPDLAIHGLTLGALVLPALRSDRRGRPAGRAPGAG